MANTQPRVQRTPKATPGFRVKSSSSGMPKVPRIKNITSGAMPRTPKFRDQP